MLRPQRGHLGRLYVAFQRSFSQLPTRNIGLLDEMDARLLSLSLLSLCVLGSSETVICTAYMHSLSEEFAEPVIEVESNAKQRISSH